MCKENTTPRITVITVVLNGKDFIEETIRSVIGQTYSHVEYIIIDGGSTDGTIEIVKQYSYAIDYWRSESDTGIYDAMNKGINLASGEWINFMNCGDKFHRRTTLEDIFLKLDVSGIDVVYGDHQVNYSPGMRTKKAGTLKNIWRGSQFCHQSCFIKSTYHKIHKYNTCNSIVADFELFYKAYKHGAIFKKIGLAVAQIRAGGVSDIQRVDSILGWWLIVDKNILTNLYYMFLVAVEVLKAEAKRAMVTFERKKRRL
jgi:glycosyltransferase involved in cell wall biosynthesis